MHGLCELKENHKTESNEYSLLFGTAAVAGAASAAMVGSGVSSEYRK